ncbi:MAG: zinc-dependent metalloprotease [Sedimentisphaerales bacterium]|nr:zinc-dependent metalloprotease [Sedimentisphaerales bacterium]
MQKLILQTLITAVLLCALLTTPLLADENNKNPDEFPKLDDVLKDYTKVVSTADGEKSLYTIWKREKDGQMLAALPADYEGKKYFFAMTVASGESFAGLQSGDMYVYWKRYDKNLALVTPNISIRSDGDQESKNSIKRLFTDRVILDIPIVTMDGASPVIDMDNLLVGQAGKFFGSSRFMDGGIKIKNPNLCKIAKAKAFPQNVELAFEVPSGNGQLKTIHYSISEIPDSTGYKTRKADDRIGFFTTTYSDYGIFKEDKTKIRFVNRWNLEKADPDLELSPPKNPIVFYIEHTTPVRYRRWVRQGVLYWNQAFEKVGISNAIEVHYQDKSSGAHMDKDPEDVRYNFIRWLSNNFGLAIGPSRVHPLTGQILDADVILTDGWIRHFWRQYHQVMPEIVMEGFSPETLAWLAQNPQWDPRIALAPPSERQRLAAEIAQTASLPYAGHPMLNADPTMIGDDEYDGLANRSSQINGMCTLSRGKAFDVAIFRMNYELANTDDDDKDDNNSEDSEDEKPEKKEPLIDGIPESFIGPQLAELACHEVGHTLGLRHNFKASSLYTLAEINSEEFKGKKPLAGSVMDYMATNMNFEDGQIQGDYTMIGVGPYDMWAIEYGYSQNEKDLPEILSRVAEPELVYGTDEDTFGPDPLARRYDFAKDPLEYAKKQVRLAKYHREKIIDKFVKEGDSWSKARKGYEMTLAMQLRAVSIMANWIGGDFINRDHKGDKNARLPIQPVPAEQQRAALDFVIQNTFIDDAFGLNSDLLKRMTVAKWWDDPSSAMSDPTWPVHDSIMAIQTSTLTMIMNPTTLRRVYDNEFLIEPDQDALTLPELLSKLDQAIWTELNNISNQKYSDRQPLISSLRRNLQRQYLERTIRLANHGFGYSAAGKPISNLAMMQLQKNQELVDTVLKKHQKNLDAYSLAHLQDTSRRIQKALDAQYTVNTL